MPSGPATFQVIAGPQFASACTLTITVDGKSTLTLRLGPSAADEFHQALAAARDFRATTGPPMTVHIPATNLDGGNCATVLVRAVASKNRHAIVALIDGRPFDSNPFVISASFPVDDLYRYFVRTFAQTILPTIAQTRAANLDLVGLQYAAFTSSPRYTNGTLHLSATNGSPRYCLVTIAVHGKRDLVLRLDHAGLLEFERMLAATVDHYLTGDPSLIRQVAATTLRGDSASIEVDPSSRGPAVIITLVRDPYDLDRDIDTEAIGLPCAIVSDNLLPDIRTRIRPLFAPVAPA